MWSDSGGVGVAESPPCSSLGADFRIQNGETDKSPNPAEWWCWKQPERVTSEPQRPILTLTAASFTLSASVNITVPNTWIHDKGNGHKTEHSWYFTHHLPVYLLSVVMFWPPLNTLMMADGCLLSQSTPRPHSQVSPALLRCFVCTYWVFVSVFFKARIYAWARQRARLSSEDSWDHAAYPSVLLSTKQIKMFCTVSVIHVLTFQPLPGRPSASSLQICGLGVLSASADGASIDPQLGLIVDVCQSPLVLTTISEAK